MHTGTGAARQPERWLRRSARPFLKAPGVRPPELFCSPTWRVGGIGKIDNILSKAPRMAAVGR